MPNDPQVNGRRIHFDGTINLGHLFIMTSVLASGLAGYFALRNTIDNHEWRLGSLESLVKEQNTVNRKTAEALSDIGRDLAVIRARTEIGGKPN